MKREIYEFCKVTSALRCWISGKVPSVQDGNNFGVEVQAQVLEEVGAAEERMYPTLEQMGKYFISRAKLVTKVIKYPNVQDYVYSVQDFDVRTHRTIGFYLMDLRDYYAVVYDKIQKNLPRIQSPRGSNSAVHAMY